MTTALVTGATGFLGRHLCNRLLRMGWRVKALGRDEAAGRELNIAGAQFLRADLSDPAAMMLACSGQDYVFHCGALSSPWGRYRDFYLSNVEGTRNVIAGCRQHGVRRLIHISTPSLYFDYRDREHIRENSPLPAKPANAYAATKRLAEEAVFRADAAGDVPSLILRPRAIFGPMDRSLFPRLLQASRKGGVPMVDGGTARLDITYVENVVDAMLLGCQAPQAALGRAYNITNGEPVILRDAIIQLFELLELPVRTRPISYPIAYSAAALIEAIYKVLSIRKEPPMTRYTVGIVAFTQSLDITEARERLGYSPRVTVQEGLRAFAEWWRAQA